MIPKAPLPIDVDALQALCTQLQDTLQEKEQQLQAQQKALTEKQDYIDYLHEQLTLLRSRRYQTQSEQLKTLQGQLFDEAELEQAIRETEAALQEAQSDRAARTDKPASKSTPKRKPLPAHLKRVEIILDMSEEDKQYMGEDWSFVGYDIAEQLAVQQRQYYVKCFKRAKYVRNEAPKSEAEQVQACLEAGIRVAPRAQVILPKSIADASLLADVIASKFVDAVSFYRKEKILQREGIDIGYSTVCDWPIQLAQRLAPLKPLLFEPLQNAELWHLDETTLQVLGEIDRKNETKSYLWVIRGGPPQQSVILFHYDTRRSYEALREWLAPYVEGFTGAIVTDEHKPYNRLAAEYANIQAHGGCWAHCRRKFAEAAKGRRHSAEPHKVLAMIAKLYKLDGRLDGLSGAEKVEARRKTVQPHLDEIKSYLEELAPTFVKQGLMNTAIAYALNHWHKLTAFINHPALPLDNNPVESAIRPFTLGRKNWLFAGSPRGAEASAFLYSLIETAKANGWEPKAYLETLFERYPYATTDEQRRTLLPMFLRKDT